MPKLDINKAGWEQSDFPILCETCLGANPFIRMSKQEFGKECGTCARPYTVFRWNPGNGARYKSTVVCQTCAKTKNICQTCLLDLEYGLPVQVRDTALGVKSQAPASDINREYYAQNQDAADKEKSLDAAGRTKAAGREMLKELARKDPYYKRNRPKLCTFFAKGECSRGEECPYRHEMPVQNELSKQTIQDRYHGNEDPVARKLLASHAEKQGLKPPDDQTVTSLFLTSLPTNVTQDSLKATAVNSLSFLDPNTIRSVVHVPKTRCAFINFTDRSSAERASEAWSHGVDIEGERVSVRWGRSKKPAATAA